MRRPPRAGRRRSGGATTAERAASIRAQAEPSEEGHDFVSCKRLVALPDDAENTAADIGEAQVVGGAVCFGLGQGGMDAVGVVVVRV